MSKTIEMDGYTYILPFRASAGIAPHIIDVKGDLIANGFTVDTAVYVAAALNDYRPWRYPSHGELPSKDGWYLVTTDLGHVQQVYFNNGAWHGRAWEEEEVRAWRELPEPAKEPEGPPEVISEG